MISASRVEIIVGADNLIRKILAQQVHQHQHIRLFEHLGFIRAFDPIDDLDRTIAWLEIGQVDVFPFKISLKLFQHTFLRR